MTPAAWLVVFLVEAVGASLALHSMKIRVTREAAAGGDDVKRPAPDWAVIAVAVLWPLWIVPLGILFVALLAIEVFGDPPLPPPTP